MKFFTDTSCKTWGEFIVLEFKLFSCSVVFSLIVCTFIVENGFSVGTLLLRDFNYSTNFWYFLISEFSFRNLSFEANVKIFHFYSSNNLIPSFVVYEFSLLDFWDFLPLWALFWNFRCVRSNFCSASLEKARDYVFEYDLMILDS